MGSVIAADMTAPVHKAPVRVYNWIDLYFGLYFAGSSGRGWEVITNPAFAFGYVGRATDFGADVFPPRSPNTFIGGSHTGADRQWGNFAGGGLQGVGINTSGTAAVTASPRCDVPPMRCGGATAQSLFQNLNVSEGIRAMSIPEADNSLSFGVDVSNSDGNYNKRGTTGNGIAGESLKGTFSYKIDWQ